MIIKKPEASYNVFTQFLDKQDAFASQIEHMDQGSKPSRAGEQKREKK